MVFMGASFGNVCPHKDFLTCFLRLVLAVGEYCVYLQNTKSQSQAFNSFYIIKCTVREK